MWITHKEVRSLTPLDICYQISQSDDLLCELYFCAVPWYLSSLIWISFQLIMGGFYVQWLTVCCVCFVLKVTHAWFREYNTKRFPSSKFGTKNKTDNFIKCKTIWLNPNTKTSNFCDSIAAVRSVCHLYLSNFLSVLILTSNNQTVSSCFVI